MLRESINADNETDVEVVLAQLRTKCNDAGISQINTDLLLKETGEVLSSLIMQGRKLSSIACSQMKATRDITGERYSIRVNFSAGVRPSGFQKVMSWLRKLGAK